MSKSHFLKKGKQLEMSGYFRNVHDLRVGPPDH